MTANHHDELISLIEYLYTERRQFDQVEQLERAESGGTLDDDRLWAIFRGLVNTRHPQPASENFLAAQDQLLQSLIAEYGISTLDDTRPSPANDRIRLWLGDITTLAVDGIVNAANSQMLGCWVPGHHCIDNAIHTYAGVQLRMECDKLMKGQGHEEPTGVAKVTSAYNLPSKYVVHTVGPIANGNPTPEHKRELASCYKSCLDAAAKHGMHSIAFCGISTGVFGFPEKEASQIAVDTVKAWLASHPETDMTVVFNVFSKKGERLYEDLLGF